jgi:hypothetical protein
MKDLFVIFLVNGEFDETGKSFFSYIQCYGTRLIWNFDHGHVVEACKGSLKKLLILGLSVST